MRSTLRPPHVQQTAHALDGQVEPNANGAWVDHGCRTQHDDSPKSICGSHDIYQDTALLVSACVVAGEDRTAAIRPILDSCRDHMP